LEGRVVVPFGITQWGGLANIHKGRSFPILAKSAAVFEPQRGDLTKPRSTAWVSSSFSPGEKVAEV